MFLEQTAIAIRSLIVFTLLTGAIYPAAITAIAQAAFPHQANGSILMRNGKAVGSELIGQAFTDPKYFWGRLSDTTPAYNASSSSGSNLGTLNPALLSAVKNRVKALKEADPGNTQAIPVDLVTASASGLDPHISVAAANYQARRVAKTRGIAEPAIRDLIDQHTQGRTFGVLGEPVVNVLALNLALDEASR